MENHLNITNQFVPYELAVKLKELGFDEGCFGTYLWEVLEIGLDIPNDEYFTRAPLWQQAFDWFIEEHNLCGIVTPTSTNKWIFKTITIIEDVSILHNYNHLDSIGYASAEKARQACLSELIKI